jgi:hypothetical protein
MAHAMAWWRIASDRWEPATWPDGMSRFTRAFFAEGLVYGTADVSSSAVLLYVGNAGIRQVR